ncbi:LacI family DNA-binding transcriptional regulator [Streptomyces sp. KM273126]|uniref:LacI family DNA-binding transcriptional regulator n=1 Tax=Streptomyces sp. KM273126 TaxID=2545247 RepID=UPI001040D8B0|nr:LacI family DNA-binding transcriptional regulator [Streptomyces sp. KM273126]MBA2813069.1 LacI family DNA-binding transcriptional regulator [Streptomyces sp. KM273126]
MADRPRNPTIIDVARLAGVSKSVVSRVVSGRGSVGEETRRRVLRAAEELGYVVNAVARAMVAHRTYTVGAFVRDAATPFYGNLLTAMQERAAFHGYRVVTATGSGGFEVSDEYRALETLAMLRVEALLVCSGLLPSEQILPFAARLPTVVAGRPETHPSITSVYCDEDEGGTALAGHLLDLGHREVAVVTVPFSGSVTLGPRTAAMTRCLRERGARVLEIPGPHRETAGAWATEVLRHPGITAVMAPSDRHAVALLEQLRLRDVAVPERLSVTGYDGIGDLTTSLIGLTHWRQPIDLIGSRAVDALVRLLDGEQPPDHHQVLNGTLVVGRTTAPPTG